MTPPVFTICIPAYRAERFLAATLGSVRAQTYPHWALVVTEDGSRDRTEEIVRAFAREVSQPVRYERHDPNRGLPATRNAAIERAETEWIALLDADDLWLPDHLADLVETIARTGADLVHSGSVLFESDTGADLELRRPDAAALADFPRSLHEGRYIIQPASVALRQELWQRAGGFDAAFQHCEDWDMWMRCARVGGKFAYTGRETCRYRKHAAALSSEAILMAVGGARALEKHLDWEQIAPTRRHAEVAQHWAAAGRMALRQAPAEAHEHYTRALAREFRVSWWLRRCAAKVLMSAWRQ